MINLFDEKDQITPPAGAEAPAVEDPKPITAQDVVAAWVDGVKDATGERPPKNMLGQVARQAKELVGEDRDPERLVAAARSLGQKVGRGYADLGREYLMASAISPARAVGGSHLPPRDAYDPENFA